MPDPSTPAPAPHYVLVLMASVTVLNVMDRQLLAVLIDPIKRDLGVSDAAMGLLTGSSFAVLHVFATVPIAVWADRGVRRSIIAMGLAAWSGLTLLTGFARGYMEIFAIRIGVGIGEATGSGPAQSLLADSYPPDRRATALAVLVMGGPIGSMVAFAGGGWLADLYGWRAAFIVFGAPGLVLAILIRTLVPEPQRGAFDRTSEGARPDTRPLSFTAALRFLVSVPTVRTIALASGCNAVGLYAVLVWSVPYMTRVHGLSTGEAGLQLAIAAGLSTALGTLAGGRLGDRLARRDLRWLAWLPGMTLALILPFAWGFAFASSAALAVSLLALASFLAGTANGPTFSIVHTIAAPQTRALAGAGVTIVNNAFGLGVAPPVVGWLNDLGAPSFGDEAIRYSLALILTVHGAAAFFCLRAASTLHRDLDAKLRLEEIER